MILVDTSVWIDHFRKSNDQLIQKLNDSAVICHPFIIGEIACGNLKNRKEILSLLNFLPKTLQVNQEEILSFIDKKKLMGKGLGIIDVNLLASALLSNVSIWSLDKNLMKCAATLKVDYK